MARELRCDVCKKPTNRIVGKLFFTPIVSGVAAGGVHSNYTHHLDVGECCQARLLRGFNFRERMTSEEYHESRRAKRVASA
jgi:hypothetical protein